MIMISFTEEQVMALTQWAEWLRTTPFHQTRYALHDPVGFCCLGIYVQYKHNIHWGEDGQKKYYIPMNYGRSFGLDATDAEAVGFNQRYLIGDTHDGTKLQEIFQYLNDDYKYTFKMIADEIDTLISTGDFTTSTQDMLFTHRI